MNSEINNIYNVCKHIADGKLIEEIDIIFIEELSELIKSITKLQRWTFGDEFLRCNYIDITDNIYEELADVIITMFQFIHKNEISCKDITEKISEKIIRYYETISDKK